MPANIYILSHRVTYPPNTMTRTSSMYEKLYHAAKTLTEEQDQHWRSMVLIPNCPSSNSTYTTTSMSTNTTAANISSTAATATALPSCICDHHHTNAIPHHDNQEETIDTIRIPVDAKKALLRVSDFLSPKDKLVQMCVALNCLTKTKQHHHDTSVPHLTAPSQSVSQSAQSNFTAVETRQSSSSSSSSSSIIDSTVPQSSEPFFGDDRPIDSSNLVDDSNHIFDDRDADPNKQLSVIATTGSEMLEVPMVDTDELIEKLVCLLIDTGMVL